MSKGRDRVVCVSLSEAEWKAFVARHPEPVTWLREQILGQIDGATDLPKPQRPVREGAHHAWSIHRV
ncbi:MAG TPA: hypothetical protein VM032_00435 [Vicinamibacterales bacterium]|nr:hypothetical protein [Vicinamibacterales bacterium]